MRLSHAGFIGAVLAALTLGGCVTAGSAQDPMAQPATLVPDTKSGIVLDSLPPPARKLDVTVYDFPDLTGQNKPNDNFAEFSRALTQGGAPILIDVLTKAGGGKWFNVVERNDLKPLLTERQIIQNTRKAVEGKRAVGLPPLRFAGVILDGGIIGYDSNETTGGLGATYLGIGADTQYRQDIVTVALRAVSVQTGRVLASVTTTKTVYSVLVHGSAFQFVAVDRLLQAEAGFTKNAPTTLAVREGIQLAVYALIFEGVKDGLWTFQNPAAGAVFMRSLEEHKKAMQYTLTALPKVPSPQPAALPPPPAQHVASLPPSAPQQQQSASLPPPVQQQSASVPSASPQPQLVSLPPPPPKKAELSEAELKTKGIY